MDFYKIEMIVENHFLQDLLHRLEKIGVKGYTAFDISRGKGIKRGESIREGIFDSRTLVFSIVKKDIANRAIDEIQPFLNDRSGALIIYKIDYASGLNSNLT